MINFYGYLGEPNINLNLGSLREGNLLLEYDPKVGEWIKRDWQEGEELKK